MRLHKSSQKPPLPPPAPTRPPAAPPKVIYLRGGRAAGRPAWRRGWHPSSLRSRCSVAAFKKLLSVCPICLRSTHALQCGCGGRTGSLGRIISKLWESRIILPDVNCRPITPSPRRTYSFPQKKESKHFDMTLSKQFPPLPKYPSITSPFPPELVRARSRSFMLPFCGWITSIPPHSLFSLSLLSLSLLSLSPLSLSIDLHFR